MNQLKALFLFILLACSLNITAQRIKGSDTVLPVSQETAEIFMKDDPDRRVTVTGGGTGVGISALMDNTTDIAMAYIKRLHYFPKTPDRRVRCSNAEVML